MSSCLVADHFCSSSTKGRLLEALEQARQASSASIRIFLERRCPDDQIDRAGQLFIDLGLEDLEQHRALLLYIAVSDGKVALLGDKILTDTVGARFLSDTVKTLIRHFADGNYRDGIVDVIKSLSRQLATYYPPSENDGESSAVALEMGDLNEW